MPTTLPHAASPRRRPIRVLVVDDSALVRQLLKTIIDAQSDMVCIALAKHAEMALSMVKELAPDVMTLDVEMPGMSGLQLLRMLMHSHPLPVLMVSSQTLDGAKTTLTALELGAVDFVTKPRIGVADGLNQHAHEVVEKIRTAASARLALPANSASRTSASAAATTALSPALPCVPTRQQQHGPNTWASTPPSQHTSPNTLPAVAQPSGLRPSPIQLIAIGASTGGTDAIRSILQALPIHCPPIAIVQHMPAGFTRSFAERLNSLCAIAVSEAQDGERLEPGHAYIAPGGKHLRIIELKGRAYAQLGDDDPVMRHRPAVDVLFRSITRHIGAPHCAAVLLTGMGADGASAMLELRSGGAHTIAQDAHSCVVYGMPREAAILGAASEILPLTNIAQALMRCAGVDG